MGLVKILTYKLFSLKGRDIDNFRVKAGVLETIDRSFYIEEGEKLVYYTDTEEVKIKCLETK